MKVISSIVLLIGALALAYISSANGGAMMAKKDAMVMKYVDASKAALDSADIAGAIKNAKMAIEVDPKSKKGFDAYSNALEKKFKPANSDTNSVATPTPAAAAPSLAPAYQEDLGC